MRATVACPPRPTPCSTPTMRDVRVDAMLALRQVKTAQLGPGPGRGHKGPIALYAERHGVSRSTAWRRLRGSLRGQGREMI